MDLREILDWAFQRHLNPLSWYIRQIFLVLLCYLAYKRKLWWIIITFFVMMSSMVWFPPPAVVNEQMQKVLEFEKQLLSEPVSAVLMLAFMLFFILAILIAFWKHSLKWGLIIVNVTLIGKVVLSVFFTGNSGWAPVGNTVFGLILINGIATIYYYYQKKKTPNKNGSDNF
jgi:cbb3-type cytochrome oxidase subunit 3